MQKFAMLLTVVTLSCEFFEIGIYKEVETTRIEFPVFAQYLKNIFWLEKLKHLKNQ